MISIKEVLAQTIWQSLWDLLKTLIFPITSIKGGVLVPTLTSSSTTTTSTTTSTTTTLAYCSRNSDCCIDMPGFYVKCVNGVCYPCAPPYTGCYFCPTTTTSTTTSSSTTTTSTTTSTSTTTTTSTSTTTTSSTSSSTTLPCAGTDRYPHVSLSCPPSAIVGSNFQCTFTYTHDKASSGGAMVSWLSDRAEYVSSSGCPRAFYTFCLYWNGDDCTCGSPGCYQVVDCEGMNNGNSVTVTIKPKLPGTFNINYRAWDWSKDKLCYDNVCDHDRDPPSGSCSPNCDEFPKTDVIRCDFYTTSIVVGDVSTTTTTTTRTTSTTSTSSSTTTTSTTTSTSTTTTTSTSTTTTSSTSSSTTTTSTLPSENCCDAIDNDGDNLENMRDPDCRTDISLSTGLNTICLWTEWDDYSNSVDYYSGWFICPSGKVVGSVNIEQYTENYYDIFYIYDANNNERYRDSGEDGTKTIDLSSYNTQKIRFRLSTDGTVVKDGVKVNSITCVDPTTTSTSSTTTSSSTTTTSSTSSSTTTTSSTTSSSTSSPTTTTSTLPPTGIECQECYAKSKCECNFTEPCDDGLWILQNKEAEPLASTLTLPLPPLKIEFKPNASGKILITVICYKDSQVDTTSHILEVREPFLECDESCEVLQLCECKVRGCKVGSLNVVRGTTVLKWKESISETYFKTSFISDKPGLAYVSVQCYEPMMYAEKEIIIEGVVEPTRTFSASNFQLIKQDNSHRINLDYKNELGEDVIFIFTLSKYGRAVNKKYVVGAGEGTVRYFIDCEELTPGTYSVSWKAFKSSDNQNPILWSKVEEMESLRC